MSLSTFTCVLILLITAATFAALTAQPAELWSHAVWGFQSEFAHSEYCEPIRNNSAVRETVNSWSNICYGLVAGCVLGCGMMLL